MSDDIKYALLGAVMFPNKLWTELVKLGRSITQPDLPLTNAELPTPSEEYVFLLKDFFSNCRQIDFVKELLRRHYLGYIDPLYLGNTSMCSDFEILGDFDNGLVNRLWYNKAKEAAYSEGVSFEFNDHALIRSALSMKVVDILNGEAGLSKFSPLQRTLLGHRRAIRQNSAEIVRKSLEQEKKRKPDDDSIICILSELSSVLDSPSQLERLNSIIA